MDRVDMIERYLKATIAAEHSQRHPSGERGPRPFVTISREAGTGGHELADAMLEVFAAQPDEDVFGGWLVYDRSVCEIVAKDPSYARSFDSLVEEEYRSRADDFFHQMVRATVAQHLVMERAFLVVRTIAGMGHAIIVGRGGSHVTRDLPQGVSIRMVAPLDDRIARAMNRLGISEREARAQARKRDEGRARLIRAHFGSDIDDPTAYDAIFNAGSLSHHDIAEAVAELVRLRAREQVRTTERRGPRNGSSSGTS